MKTRLAALPPPNDAVGLMKPGTATPSPPPSAPPAGATRSFSIDDTPLTGEIPADWGARKTEAGTIVFEGTKGTEAYEVSVELEVVPKASVQGYTVLELAQVVYAQLSQRPNAQIQPPRAGQTSRGQNTATVSGAYTTQVQGGTCPSSTSPPSLTTRST